MKTQTNYGPALNRYESPLGALLQRPVQTRDRDGGERDTAAQRHVCLKCGCSANTPDDLCHAAAFTELGGDAYLARDAATWHNQGTDAQCDGVKVL